jgi:hypothetical protein
MVELFCISVRVVSSTPGTMYDVLIEPSGGDSQGFTTLVFYDRELAQVQGMSRKEYYSISRIE